MFDDQKAKRVKCSKFILTILLAQQTRDLHDIVTLDESWFDCITGHEPIWLPPDGKVPDRERVTIQSKNVMLTFAWGPTGFAGMTALKSGANSTPAIMRAMC
jgi:hypothetical protein